MSSLRRSSGSPRGFTLIEVLVMLAAISVLAVLFFILGSRAMEKANLAVDISKMRQINSGILARAVENNDLAYTSAEVGNSSYRQWGDPLGLGEVLEDYISGEEVWLSPVASKFQKKYRNSYAWSRSKNLTEKRLSMIKSPHNTLTLWNSYCYTLPSVWGVPDGGTSGGPRTAPRQYWSKPWHRGTAVNWFYLDGHVETR